MHVPGHNPYISTVGQGSPISVDALLNYISGIEGEGWDQSFTTSQASGAFDVNLPTYQYQGLNEEIMGALGNVFTPTGASNFSPLQFGESNIQSQIESQLSGMSQEELDALIGGDLYTDPYTYGSATVYPEQLVSFASLDDFDFGNQQNIENALAFTDVFDPESLANTLSQMAGVNPYDPNASDEENLGAIRAGEVKALTPEMIEKTEGQYYEPLEEAKRADLVEQKVKSLGGVSTGGFAGSGGRQSGLSGAERLYQGGYEDLISQIEGMKASATEDVLSTIYGWQELMTGV